MSELLPKTSEDTDCELMLYLQYKEGEDENNAKMALKALLNRHHEYLVGTCEKYLKSWPDLNGGRQQAEELVMDTWKKVYDHADSYKEAPTNERKISARVFRAWAGAILKNTTIDWLDKKRNVTIRSFYHVGYDEENQEGYPTEMEQINPNNRLADADEEEIFNSLSPKESEVIRELLLHLGTDILTESLDRGLAQEIALKLETTPENLRQLKSRAIKKIRAKFKGWKS